MDIWKAAASGPLAAILYTVAATRRTEGLAAARQIAADIDRAYPAAEGREWTEVANRCPNEFLAQCLRSSAAMNCPFSFDLSQLVAADLGCDRSSENRVREDPAVEAGRDLRCDRSSENATGRLKTDMNARQRGSISLVMTRALGAPPAAAATPIAV